MPPSWRLKRAETIEQTAHAEPAPPRALNPAVPRDPETICLKCLAKEPARRFATAREVGEEIGRWVEGAPIVARPTPWWERAWFWARRQPAMAGALAAVALLLGALLLVLVLSSLRIRQAQGETTAKLRQVYRQQARAERQGGQVGRRFLSLAALSNTAALKPGADEKILLRNEAVATFALADMMPVRRMSEAVGPDSALALDGTLQRHARITTNGIVAIHDSEDRELRRLPGVGAPAELLHGFSRSNRYLAARYLDGSTRVWDLEEWRLLFTVSDAVAWSSAVAFGQHDTWVAVAKWNGELVIHELPSGRPVASWKLPGPADYVAFGAGGPRLVACQRRGSEAWLWNGETGQPGPVLRHPLLVGEAAWHPDGTKVATAGKDWEIRLWDTETGTLLQTLKGHQGEVGNVCFTQDGSYLIGDRDGLSGLTVEADQESRRIRLGRRNHLAAGSGWGRSALSVDGSTFAVARDRHIEVFDARTLQRRAITGDQAGEWVFSVALNRDGSRLAMGGWHGPSVSVWNGGDGKLLRHLSGLSPTVGDTCSVQFAPEDELLVSTGYELLRFPKDLTEARWRVPMREIFCPSILSPNGRVLAVRYRQSLTQLRDAETGLELATLDGANDAHIEELAFDDEGGTLGLLNNRGELWLWHLAGIRHQRAGLKLDWDDTVGLPSEAPTR